MQTFSSGTGSISTLSHRIYAWFAQRFDDQQPRGAIASLDGVRAMAFLIVLVLHMSIMTKQLGLWNEAKRPFVSALFNAGFSGVTLFFVLSGFLLFLPYARALLYRTSWPEIKVFFMRRVLRIFPLYYFSLFVFIMVGHPDFLTPSHWKSLFHFFTFTMGFFESQIIDGPYWSLAAEFQYYVLLPFIALAIAAVTFWLPAKARFWGVAGCLLLMVAWGLGTRRWGEYYLAHPQDAYFVAHPILHKVLTVVYGDTGKSLEDFAVGMLAALLYTAVRYSPQKERYTRLLGRLVYGFVALSLVLFVLGAMRAYTALIGYYGWPLVPRLFTIAPWSTELMFALSYGGCIVAVLFNRSGGLLQRIFSWNPLRWLGHLTFSLYIWHVPFLFGIQAYFAPTLVRHLPPMIAYIACWVVVFGVAATFSFLTYMMIEKPAMRLSERLRQSMAAKSQSQKQIPPENSSPVPVEAEEPNKSLPLIV